MCYWQESISPALVAAYAGDANAGKRAALSQRARATMRTKLHCAAMPDVQVAIAAMLRTAYPPWYTAAFVLPAFTGA